MMQTIELKIKEGAYDKIVYLLEHFKDELEIIYHNTTQNKQPSNTPLSQHLDREIKNLKVVNQKGADETALFIKEINQAFGNEYQNSNLGDIRDEYLTHTRYQNPI